MDRATLAAKITWNLQERWHLRHTPAAHEISLKDTVRGLQQLLLRDQGTELGLGVEAGAHLRLARIAG